MTTTSGVGVLILVLCLVPLSLALPAGMTCGSEEPIRPASGVGKSVPACGRHECDDPAVRDQYLLNSESQSFTINMNIVYFGDLTGGNATVYNSQLAFFQREYAKHMNISWQISTSVVNNQYQVVNASDRTFHSQIASQYYVAGAATILLTTFDPNPDNLLGYAYYPQSLDFDTHPEMWFGIIDLKNGIAPTGTTLLHEVGHMLGLFHTFTSDCKSCMENIDSPNLDIVGDFCSDTKPVWVSFECDKLTPRNYDCNNVAYTTDLSQLPQDNYMAYTPDSCQDQFTPQQAARARCYVDKLLKFAIVMPPGTTAPQAVASPSSGGKVPVRSPVKAPSTKVVSIASRADFVAMLIGLVFIIVSL